LKKTNKYLTELGNNIRQIRIKSGLSQEKLALNSEIDRSYLGGIERGERNISFLTLTKIANSLKCDVAAFTKNIPNDY